MQNTYISVGQAVSLTHNTLIFNILSTLNGLTVSRFPEEYCKQDGDKKRVAGKDVPGCAPVAYRIEYAADLGRTGEMVYDRLGPYHAY